MMLTPLGASVVYIYIHSVKKKKNILTYIKTQNVFHWGKKVMHQGRGYCYQGLSGVLFTFTHSIWTCWWYMRTNDLLGEFLVILLMWQTCTECVRGHDLYFRLLIVQSYCMASEDSEYSRRFTWTTFIHLIFFTQNQYHHKTVSYAVW